MIHIEKEEAENLGECKIFSVLDPACSELLNKIIDKFWRNLSMFSPFTSFCV